MERELIQVLMKMATGRKRDMQLLRINAPEVMRGGGSPVIPPWGRA